MEKKFTPGEWDLEGDCVITKASIEGNVICQAPDSGCQESLKFWPANAALLMSAPELLATSEFFVKKVQDIIEICQRYLEPGNYNQADALSDILESIDNAEIVLKLKEGEVAIKKANP